MCVQCMMGAMTAGAAVTGTRSWLAAHRPSWLGERALRRVTMGLLGLALVASATVLGGAGG
jgi:hypothetical protein